MKKALLFTTLGLLLLCMIQGFTIYQQGKTIKLYEKDIISQQQQLDTLYKNLHCSVEDICLAIKQGMAEVNHDAPPLPENVISKLNDNCGGD